MKLVFTAEEVAAALQKQVHEFERLRPSLEAAGFPRPIVGLDDRWSIMDVISWVNRDNAEQGSASLRSLSHPLGKLHS